MKKGSLVFILLLTSLLFAYSCKKAAPVTATKICLHDSSIDYLKRWALVLTQTDVYNTSGSLQSRTVIHPDGYFQINSDFTYNLYSDNTPVNGKWSINNNCQFVLNPNMKTEKDYSVITLSADSLTISQTIGRTAITQHYASFTCPSLTSLEYRWDSAFTIQASYTPDSLSAAKYIYPGGYFRLYPDASYSISDNTTPMPINGTWGIAQTGCLLILDNNKPNQRSYDVQKITEDSLVIWRKDTALKMNYLNHYSKHK